MTIHAHDADAARPTMPPGLVFTTDAQPGIQRLRRGKGFAYRRHDGRPVRATQELLRIRQLAIPPAYRQVWICQDPRGHLQATGRDARGRKQYRYHPEWRVERDADKFERLLDFSRALPRIRRRVARDLCAAEKGRTPLLAAIVRLLDTTAGRIGNDTYARENGSYGLSTLRCRHVRVNGDAVALEFRGKSGVAHSLAVRDAHVARLIRGCLGGPMHPLFRYTDDKGRPRCVGAADVNAYLHEIAGGGFTAKDFRTWHASVRALEIAQHAATKGDKGFALKKMLAEVAAALGNTPAVCRKSYVHPRVLDLAAQISRDAQATAAALPAPAHMPGLRRGERALVAFMQQARNAA